MEILKKGETWLSLKDGFGLAVRRAEFGSPAWMPLVEIAGEPSKDSGLMGVPTHFWREGGRAYVSPIPHADYEILRVETHPSLGGLRHEPAPPPRPLGLTLAPAKDGGFVVRPLYEPMAPPEITYAGSLKECLEYMQAAFSPPMVFKPKGISDAELQKLMAAGPGNLTIVPAATPMTDYLDRVRDATGIKDILRSEADPLDLEDVLDVYRLEGRMAGVQVVSLNEVVCWPGDIQDVFRDLAAGSYRAWGPAPPPLMFRKFWGPNALADAAKWLLDERDRDLAANPRV